MFGKITVLFLVILLNAALAAAQANINGALKGRVADANDAAVTGANVSLKNAETGRGFSAVMDDAGNFAFPLLQPGVYSLTVEKSGYKRAARENIIITVGETAIADVTLEVGEVTEIVTIESGAEIVQTQTTEISQIINENRIENLPLNGKNFQQLINLAPGVGGVIAQSGGITNPSISGARPVANSFSIDGVATNDERTTTGLSIGGGAAGLSGGGSVAPNLVSTEALQEFRVITSNSDATYGRGSGGAINAVTKSGTNRFTGSLYECHRNDAFDARNFFNRGPFFNSDGSAKNPPFRQNLFGGTFGGRIVRDKHFFFGSYEGFRQRLDQSITATVPNADLLNLIPGDLGRLFRTFYLERNIVAAGNYTGFTALTAAQRAAAITAGFNAALFDGNTANGEAGTQLISTTSKRDITQNAFLVRTDHNFTNRFSANLRYAYAQPTQDTDSIATTGTVTRNYRQWQQYFGQFLFTLSGNQILEIRGGLNKTGFENGLQNGVDPRLTAIGVSDQTGLTIRVNGTSLSPLASNASVGVLDNQTVPQISALHTFSGGGYTVRAGVDVRQVRNKIRLFSTNPNYTFTGITGANGILGASPTATQAVAASAGGTIYGLNNSPPVPLRNWTATEQEYFAQTDWRVSNDVTLNLGLRYSYFGVYKEKDNLAANLYAVDYQGNLVTNVSPFTYGRTQNRIATISDDVPLYQPDKDNLQPRLGVAWNVGGRNSTVIRAGYGLYFDRFYQLLFSDGVINPPYAVSTSATNITYRLGQPFPINAGLSTIYILDQRIQNPITHRFNAAVEQRLDNDTSVTVAYVGARSRDLFRWQEVNAEGLTPQALRPDSRFADMRFVTNASKSRYDSLQIFARRRFARNLDFTAAYTFAKSTDDFSSDASFAGRTPSLLNLGASPAAGFQGGGRLFVNRPREADEGASDFDVRHALVISHIYDLPFGRGKQFLKNSNRIVDTILGGWSLRGIFTYRSGEPFSVTLGTYILPGSTTQITDYNDDGSVANDYPRLLSGNLSALYANGSGDRTQFLVSRSTAQTLLGLPSDVRNPFETVGRNAFRSPRVMFYDASLAKKFFFTERINLSVEINAFNVFNTVNFAAPVSVLSAANFGQVTSTRAGTNPRQLQLGAKLNF
jgi:hypothetical protein